MKIKTKANLVSIVSFLIIYAIYWTIIYFIFDRVSILMVSAITMGLTVLLLPQQRIVSTPNGNHIELKWSFSKKTITIK